MLQVSRTAVICGGFKIMAVESLTHTHTYTNTNTNTEYVLIHALGFQRKLGLVRQNGEYQIGDSLLLSCESPSQWAPALNANLLKFNSRIDINS